MHASTAGSYLPLAFGSTDSVPPLRARHGRSVDAVWAAAHGDVLRDPFPGAQILFGEETPGLSSGHLGDTSGGVLPVRMAATSHPGFLPPPPSSPRRGALDNRLLGTLPDDATLFFATWDDPGEFPPCEVVGESVCPLPPKGPPRSALDAPERGENLVLLDSMIEPDGSIYYYPVGTHSEEYEAALASMGYEYGHRWTSCEVELTRKAWGLLYENQDLVEWAMCAAGADSDLDCLLAYFTGSKDIELHFKLTCDPGTDAAFTTLFNNITICRTGLFGIDVELYCSGRGGSAEQECAIVDLAASLFHELTHTCLRAIGDQACECRVSYVAENLFRWALFQRYPEAASSPCCSDAIPPYGDSCYFGAETDCLPPVVIDETPDTPEEWADYVLRMF